MINEQLHPIPSTSIPSLPSRRANKSRLLRRLGTWWMGISLLFFPALLSAYPVQQSAPRSPSVAPSGWFLEDKCVTAGCRLHPSLPSPRRVAEDEPEQPTKRRYQKRRRTKRNTVRRRSKRRRTKRGTIRHRSKRTTKRRRSKRTTIKNTKRRRSKRKMPDSPIHLNQATKEDLMRLPRVGPVMAQKILQLRQSLGGRFTKIEQLRQVRGIGPKTLLQIKPYITLQSGDSKETKIRTRRTKKRYRSKSKRRTSRRRSPSSQEDPAPSRDQTNSPLPRARVIVVPR